MQTPDSPTGIPDFGQFVVADVNLIQHEAQADSAVKEALARMRANAIERRYACHAAQPALERLCVVMKARTGQSAKVRNLLYSLWNGKPAPLIDVVSLDFVIRKDLCAVLLAFGYEDQTIAFFYDAIKAAVQRAGQWDWFLEEADNLKLLADYAKRGAHETHH